MWPYSGLHSTHVIIILISISDQFGDEPDHVVEDVDARIGNDIMNLLERAGNLLIDTL